MTPGEYIPRFLTTVYTKLWPKNIQLSCITAITSKIDISNNREYVLDWYIHEIREILVCVVKYYVEETAHAQLCNHQYELYLKLSPDPRAYNMRIR